MIQTVLEKAKRVQHDTEEQERIFKASASMAVLRGEVAAA